MAKKRRGTFIGRFSGADGKARLIDSLQNQFIVGGDIRIARSLAKKVKLAEFEARKDLMSQGDVEDDLVFILGGSVEILVNGRVVATRTADQHVGEIGMLDTTAVRSATVRTLEPTVAARISEAEFSKIATVMPSLWRRMALALSKRIRERNKFHKLPREQSAIFIGSSSEGLAIAKSIHSELLKDEVVPVIWSQGVFECSQTAIEDLVAQAGTSDFAIIVLTGDDVTKSRGRAMSSPRDNVIFELGLFMGSLSRERTFIVAQKDVDLKLPTDLLGVTTLRFSRRTQTISANSLRSVLAEIRKQIRKYGPI
jgi:CRP/FNR family transcriptional regulator, cyclic AMP receptor protein